MIALISKDAGGAEFISRYISSKKEKFCFSIDPQCCKHLYIKFKEN